MSTAFPEKFVRKSAYGFHKLTSLLGSVTPGFILGTAGSVQLILLVVRMFSAPPYGDSDIFQYIGWYMGHGGTLYESCWDNKGPLVFVFNATGMLFGETGFKIYCFLVALAILGLMYKAFAFKFSRTVAAWELSRSVCPSVSSTEAP